MVRSFVGLAAALALGACASTGGPEIDAGAGGSAMAKLGQPKQSDDIMGGGRYVEPWLSASIKDAAQHPLGSDKNPVRAEMPGGQHAYLARLRCANGKAPTFSRNGNLGFGAFGSIVDAYDVKCPGSSPAQTTIVMDMYFPGYVEMKAVAGFTITP